MDAVIPVLQYPTMDQFENIPKYMKGKAQNDKSHHKFCIGVINM